MKTKFFLLLFLLPFALLSQNLVIDLNTEVSATGNRIASDFYKINDKLVFITKPTSSGEELYVTDGTTQGTHILKDIYPGNLKSILGLPGFPENQRRIAILDDQLYFPAYSPEYGYSVWQTDGTSGGTRVFLPFLDAPIRELISDGNKLFFITGFPTYGVTINNTIRNYPKEKKTFSCWVSDGTTEGTRKIQKEFYGLLPNIEAGHADGAFYFLAQLDEDSQSLIRCDGTEAGTYIIKDGFFTQNTYSHASGINIGLNQNWYFLAADSTGWESIWKTNGLSTERLVTIAKRSSFSPRIAISDVREIDGNMYWLFNFSDTLSIWKSDGSQNGTIEIFNRTSPDFFGISELSERNDSLLFLGPGPNPIIANTAIYMMDPLTYGTRTTQEINIRGSVGRYNNRSNKSLFFRDDYGGWMLALKTGYPKNLWFTGRQSFSFQEDTTIEAYLYTDGIAALDSNFYYYSYYLEHNNAELSKHAGTIGSNTQVNQLGVDTHGFYDLFSRDHFGKLPNNDSLIFFPAKEIRPNNRLGDELFRTDGSRNGTQMINISQIYGSSPRFLTPFKDKLIFVASGSINLPKKPYISDGTETGTQLLFNVGQSTDGGITSAGFVVLRDSIYFSGETLITPQLWLSDGTSAGTKVVKSYSGPRTVKEIKTYLDQIYVLVRYDSSSSNRFHYEVWKLHTQTGQSSMIHGNLGFVRFMGETAHGIVMSSYDSQTGHELWISDGDMNVSLLKDIYRGNGDSNPSMPVVFKGDLYFLANDSIHGNELWKTDGSLNGTEIVKDINPGIEAGLFEPNFYIWQDQLYFQASNGINGVELWSTDGTSTGTQMREDIVPGKAGSFPTKFFGYDSTLYFSAFTAQSGVEFWSKEGNGSSQMIWDITSGPESSNPIVLGVVNDKLLFFADKDTLGWELYDLSLSATGIKDLSEEKEWKVYPNPAVDHIIIDKVDGLDFPLEISIINMAGQELAWEILQHANIDISMLPVGAYILKVKHKNELLIHKFIKK